MTQQFQSTAEIQAQAESARKREIDFPMTLIGAGCVLGCGALIWAGFANPDAFGRLSDSLVTLFFIAYSMSERRIGSSPTIHTTSSAILLF